MTGMVRCVFEKDVPSGPQVFLDYFAKKKSRKPIRAGYKIWTQGRNSSSEHLVVELPTITPWPTIGASYDDGKLPTLMNYILNSWGN